MKTLLRLFFTIPLELTRSYRSILNFKWLVLGVVVGAMTGLGAIIFYVAIEWLHHFLLHELAKSVILQPEQ